MAKWRISTDIASHYEEAVEGHLQNGLPMRAAETAALAELGDAKAAARRFRQAHLTKWDFALVSLLLRSAPRNWVGHVVRAAWFFLICLLTLHQFHVANILAHGVVAALIFSRIVAIVMARRESAIPTKRLVVLMGAVNMFGYGVLTLVQYIVIAAPVIIFAPIPTSKVCLVPPLVAGSLLIAWSLSLFRLRNKLGTMPQDWMGATGEGRREIPPENPAAS